MSKYKVMVLAAHRKSKVTVQVLEFNDVDQADMAAKLVEDYSRGPCRFKVEAIKLYLLPFPQGDETSGPAKCAKCDSEQRGVE